MKRIEILKVVVVIAVLLSVSAAVPDPRLMPPPKGEPIASVLHTKVDREIREANHRIFLQTINDEPALAQEEVIEEVEKVIEEATEVAEAEDDLEAECDIELPINQEESIFEPGHSYIGTFEITAYEWTGNPCANGNYPTEGYTVACNSLPLGTEVYIEGIGYRTVEDRGATWHSDSWLDLYLGDEASCYEWGIQYREVWIVE